MFDEEKQIFAGVKLQGLFKDCLNHELYEMSFFEFEIFDGYLNALLQKLDNKKSKEVQSNIARLEWMKRFLHRQKYKNKIQELQAHLLSSLQMDCRNYEIKIIDLEKQIERLKSNL